MNAAGNISLGQPDFSLVLGGPLYQLYLRMRLARPDLELVLRRIIGLVLICWLPPFVLALLAGQLFGGASVPFLLDPEVHAKFLGALPLLIGSEVLVHDRFRNIVGQFLDRGIIAPKDRESFDHLVASSMRLRNSVFVEVLLLLLALTVWHWIWSHDLTLGVSSWYSFERDGRTRLTAAGCWYAFISLPIFRFLLLRWYFRICVWYRFLWGVRKLPLHFNFFHPDRAGGLGFLAGSVFAFAPVLVAQTVVFAGMIGNRIWHAEAALPSFKLEIVGAVLFLMTAVLTPLTFFMLELIHAGRAANREFGILASRYVDDFRRKWTQPNDRRSEALLGTSDIQSLADLGNSYSMVSEMRILPFNSKTILRLAMMIVAPLVPLTLTMIPLERIVDGLIKLLL
jgi:hypothetical protein